MREAARLYPGRIAVGIDARDGWVAVEGWAKTSNVSALDIGRRFEDAGVAAIIYTDISRDGALQGLNIASTVALAEALAIPVIASGGLASIEDVRRLTEPDCARLAGAIAGRALYDGRLDPREALALLRARAARPRPGRRSGAMTLKARVIPCLDVKDGRVVKGVNFVNLRDAGDPVESAIAYDRAGADELCFLDITASHEDRGILLDVVRRTAEVCFMPLTVGGGVRTTDDIRNLLLAGADKASINSAAVADRQFVRLAAEKFGSQCVVVAIDAKRVSGEGEPAALGDLHPRRPAADRHRRGRLRARGDGARRGRDPAHLDGPGRLEDRLRPRAHPRDRRRGADPGDRVGRRRQSRPSGRTG